MPSCICDRTAPIEQADASVSSTKTSESFGIAIVGAEVSVAFSVSNASWHCWFHMNCRSLPARALRGAAMRPKSLTKRL